jgi:hypothetical protein
MAMTQRHWLPACAVLAAGLGYAVLSAQSKPAVGGSTVMVYKSATCGCCTAWVEHLRANGFQVEAQNVSDAQLNAVAAQGGVRDDLRSCHTAKVGGYTVEGHVPAADIQRMLKDKPAIAGISVPNMPMGAPGMEQGGLKDPFDTIAFTKDGKTSVFAHHR